MIIAIISALALGCALPAAMLVFGDLVNAFINQEVYMIILSRKREREGEGEREKNSLLTSSLLILGYSVYCWVSV